MSDNPSTALPSRRSLRLSAEATTPQAGPVSRRERRLSEQAATGSVDLIGVAPTGYPSAAPSDHYSTPLASSPPVAAPPVAPPPVAPPAPALSRRQLRALEEQTEQTVSAVPVAAAVEPPPVVVAQPAVALPPVFAPATGSLTVEAPTAPSRTVGVASAATNALILPTAPSVDLAGPIGDTGEILVTGNIPLPRLVSERAMTGLVDIDTDEDLVSVDTGAFTAPIRATQAVSTRSMEIDQPMIKRPSWGVPSMVLGFSAAILGVTALGLLALALLTDIIELPF